MITITGNGRLTRDVELRSTHSGKRVARISVASDRQAPALFVDSSSGNARPRPPPSTWPRVRP